MADDNKKLRIIFMGTPDFSVPALEHLVAGPHEVVCVYSQPPRPKGRGHQIQLSPVQQCAEKHGIEIRTPISFKNNKEARAAFDDLKADVAVVAAYGLILPQDILDMPRFGCINIHASLLPRWRGAAPIHYSIWKGDEQSGITIMQMEKGLDTGPMIEKKEVTIHDYTTSQSLHDELSALGGVMICGVMDQLAAKGKLKAEAQNDKVSSYASMLKKEDGIVDWSQNALEIDRQIRALNPWPGVWTSVRGKRFKILAAERSDECANIKPGALIHKGGHIACGGGSVIKLLLIQPENAKSMDFVAALNGNYIKPEDVLGA